jgi:hypothetical protein
MRLTLKVATARTHPAPGPPPQNGAGPISDPRRGSPRPGDPRGVGVEHGVGVGLGQPPGARADLGAVPDCRPSEGLSSNNRSHDSVSGFYFSDAPSQSLGCQSDITPGVRTSPSSCPGGPLAHPYRQSTAGGVVRSLVADQMIEATLKKGRSGKCCQNRKMVWQN